jgi:catechol 2,3-dioxygenase-like lactoylglutathione lyase family enzyme
MLDHMILTVSDVERSLAFYEAALKPLNSKVSPIQRLCIGGSWRHIRIRSMTSTQPRCPDHDRRQQDTFRETHPRGDVFGRHPSGQTSRRLNEVVQDQRPDDECEGTESDQEPAQGPMVLGASTKVARTILERQT